MVGRGRSLRWDGRDDLRRWTEGEVLSISLDADHCETEHVLLVT